MVWPVRRFLAALAYALLALGIAAHASPRNDYLINCMGCHLEDGTGTPGKIPALRGRVGYYLQLPTGRDYLLHVPGAANAPLSAERLAAVMNWVIDAFAGVSAPDGWERFSAAEISAGRAQPPDDIDAWRARLWQDIEIRFPEAAASY